MTTPADFKDSYQKRRVHDRAVRDGQREMTMLPRLLGGDEAENVASPLLLGKRVLA